MGTACLLAAILSAPLAAPQEVGSAAESAAVVLSPRIARPRVPGFLRGRGWRALWADTVRLPVLDLGLLGGGVARADPEPGPLAGVVIVWGANGLAYRLLPVDRDPVTATLPPNLRGTGLSRVLGDLVATNHPSAPLLAVALYRAAGLDVMEPALVVLPPDAGAPQPLAGLAGRAVWIERAPEVDGGPWGRFGQVITSGALLERVGRDPTVRLDLSRFLAARLLDLVLGDRNGPPGHWLWGLDTAEARDSVWAPIATREEEALLNADSRSRLILSLYQPGFGVLNPGMPNVAELAARGVDFDRPLLARLGRGTWDSVCGALAASLTDTAIVTAVSRLPAEHRDASGVFLANTLAARRDALPDIAAELYRLVATYPDIELSDASERVTLSRRSRGDLELVVAAGERETIRRLFRSRETEELRLHLEGGADTVRLEGARRTGVGVRITSKQGTVSLSRDGSRTRRVVLYADPDRVRLEPADAVRLVPRAQGRWLRWRREDLPPTHPDWGTRRSPIFEAGLGGDLGLVVGGGAQWRWYGFGEPNYRQRLRVELRYVGKPSRVAAGVEFERRNVLRNLHLLTELRMNSMDVLRYFGYGNETRNIGDSDFYRVELRDLTLRAAVAVSSQPDLELRLGPVLALGSSDTVGTATLAATTHPYGTGDFDAAGLQAQFLYAPARGRYQPGLGMQVRAEASGYPGWLDVTRGGFGLVKAETRLTWAPRPDARLTVASRLGGVLAVGTAPLRFAPRIGGWATLRGYQADRFTGDRGAAYGALELRLRAGRAQVDFVTLDFGVLGFGDAGRVWSRGESSSTLHTAAGGGLWVAPALGWIPAIDALVLRLDLARSVEGTIVSFGTAFRF